MGMARGAYSSKNGDGIGLVSTTLLTIKLPDTRALRILSRSLFIAMILIVFPLIRYIVGGKGEGERALNVISVSPMEDETLLPNLFHDLVEEGLLKKGQKGLIIANSDNHVKDLIFLNQNGIEFIVESDINMEMVGNEAFDFVFVSSFQDPKHIDRIVKTGGMVISSLSNLQQLENYKIVYLRRFENHIMTALRNINPIHGLVYSPGRRILSTIAPETKKAALSKLEDAMLEPPRRKVKNLTKGSRKMRFLPDLLKDNLENYPRRIFISDGKKGVIEWFRKNYPTKNQEFEVYNMEIETYEPEGSQSKDAPKVSDWLKNNVKEEDYVVMKAEAMVVEEIIRQRTIRLVDELFLECNNQWEDGENENLSTRAYWQCLELYGRLRDEGVAVHQWWS